MKPGTIVRMTDAFKAKANELNREHVNEFGGCVGVVEGPMCELFPDIVDVRWLPLGLRFGYLPSQIEVVKDSVDLRKIFDDVMAELEPNGKDKLRKLAALFGLKYGGDND